MGDTNRNNGNSNRNGVRDEHEPLRHDEAGAGDTTTLATTTTTATSLTPVEMLLERLWPPNWLQACSWTPNNHQSGRQHQIQEQLQREASTSVTNNPFAANPAISSSVSLGSLTIPTPLSSSSAAYTGSTKKGTTSSSSLRRRIPIVTLFFDLNKHCTVAVLSGTTDHPYDTWLTAYWQHRVRQGTAIARSSLYYELKGYVRRNQRALLQLYSTHVQQQQQGISPDIDTASTNDLLPIRSTRSLDNTAISPRAIRQTKRPAAKAHMDFLSVAIGSMAASDEAHGRALLKKRRAWLERHHVRPTDPALLQQALEICRLHRLGDDLDVVSIQALYEAGDIFARTVAIPLMEQCLQHRVSLIVTPYVDGTPATLSYSNFVRTTTAVAAAATSISTTTTLPPRPLVRVSEAGRWMEYQPCSDIVMVAVSSGQDRNKSDTSKGSTWDSIMKDRTPKLTGVFVPRSLPPPRPLSEEPVSMLALVRDGRGVRDADAGVAETAAGVATATTSLASTTDAADAHINTGTSATFHWQCHELALANLHRWWGDIVASDYVGQKLVLSWCIPTTQSSSSSSSSSPHAVLPNLLLEDDDDDNTNYNDNEQNHMKAVPRSSRDVTRDLANASEGGQSISRRTHVDNEDNGNNNNDGDLIHLIHQTANTEGNMHPPPPPPQPSLGQHGTTTDTDNCLVLPLASLRLGGSPAVGVQTWILWGGGRSVRVPASNKVAPSSSSSSLLSPLLLVPSLTVHVQRSYAVVRTDDVTMTYGGQATVVQAQVPWACLVHTVAARQQWPHIQRQAQELQKERPLLPHENSYVRWLEKLAAVSSHA